MTLEPVKGNEKEEGIPSSNENEPIVSNKDKYIVFSQGALTSRSFKKQAHLVAFGKDNNGHDGGVEAGDNGEEAEAEHSCC